ncbi:MAG: flagellar hook-basal body protein [Bacillus sp. (in: firmicutes)]
MLRGFYTAASGMITQQRRTEMLTNNISNANTIGFKTDQSTIRAFPEMLLQEFSKSKADMIGQAGKSRFVGGVNTGVYVQETLPAFTQGDLAQTGQATDLALQHVFMPVNASNGKEASVFFVVDHGGGNISYTRNGSFTLDQQGYLTTAAGHYVLDQQGQRIQLSSNEFTVDENGTIRQGEELVASLGIAYADNPHVLEKKGNGLYERSDGNALPLYGTVDTDAAFRVSQGMVEKSNVDVTRSMTEMMAAYRSFEANQKVLQAYDQSLQKTVGEIGRI